MRGHLALPEMVEQSVGFFLTKGAKITIFNCNVKQKGIFRQTSMEEFELEKFEHLLRLFLETELGFMDASSVEIQRVHRLGKKKENEPRPILARFWRYKDCEKILSLGSRLKDSNYKMYQDLPYEIVQRRKQLMATFKKAKTNKIPAAFSKAQPDKLFVRGKLWPKRKFL